MPFIGLLLPFVGRSRPQIRPFIGKNQPFVLNRAFGFTLIELIITVTIAGILMGLAAPGFVSFVKNNRLSSQVNELMADLAFARSEGVKRGTNVIVCKSDNPTAATPACNAGAQWEDGWIIGIDANLNKVLEAGELIVRVHEPLTGKNTVRGTGDLDDKIAYVGSGLITPAIAGSFRVCDDRGLSHGKSIDISTTGRAAIAKDAAGNPMPPTICP